MTLSARLGRIANACAVRPALARDFALQHLGKCLADAGRIDEARTCLLEARALRRAKGDAELVASTEAALTSLARSAGSSSASSSASGPAPC